MASHTLIIAEAGVNHNGNLLTAMEMVDVAKECGVDIIKFQTAKLDSLVSSNAPMAEYQKNNTGKVESQKDMLKRLLLSFEDFVTLANYCNDKGIKFLSTPFDIESIHFLDGIQDIWKIPSGEITNYPYLVEIAKTGKDIIMSTGMSTLDEVNEAVGVLKRFGSGEISLLHCTTDYPTPMKDVNLNAMLSLKRKYETRVGYSDHTRGIEVPIAAVAMGAEIIEKHFTLDRNMEGPDHKASLEPKELYDMVCAIRNIELARGDGEKRPSKTEIENIKVARKSIVASRKIKKGETFTEENLTTKRPGTGINPMNWLNVIGKRSKRDYNEDELIEI